MYRSVLLNNGRHGNTSTTKTPPKSSENEEAMETEITTGSVAMDTKMAVAKDTTDVDAVLFKDNIAMGTRGDIIQFYNKIFIGYVKDFVLKFTSDEVITCTCTLYNLICTCISVKCNILCLSFLLHVHGSGTPFFDRTVSYSLGVFFKNGLKIEIVHSLQECTSIVT